MVAVGAAFPAASQDWSYGNGFYAACKDAVVPPAKSPEWAGIACLSYVKGLHDMAGFMWSSGRIRPEVCPPERRIDKSALRHSVEVSLKDHPDQRHKPTAALLWEALPRRHFPAHGERRARAPSLG